MRIVSLAVAVFLATLGVVSIVMLPIVVSYTPAWRLALLVLMTFASLVGAIAIYWLVEIRDALARRS